MSILTDGYQCSIDLAAFGSGSYMEILSLKPMGVDGGDIIDLTSMSNSAWRTGTPKSLKALTNGTIKVKYDPSYNIAGQVNVNQEIVVTFPDSTTLTFWGSIGTWDPDELTEGELPTGTLTLVSTNLNDSGEEVAPAWA